MSRERKHGWTLRAASLAIPAAILGLATTGVAVAGWPESDSALTTQPALAAGTPTPTTAVRDDSTERTTRLLDRGRPALNDLSAAQSAARKKAVKEEVAAEKKAADEKAAQEKKKEKAAAKKRAEAKQEARAKKEAAARDKAQARDRAEAKRKAAVVVPTRAQLRVSGKRYTRVALNVRKQPTSSAGLVTVLSAGSKLTVTDTTKGSWTLVIHQGKGRWVHSQYLTRSKPKPAKTKTSSNGKARSSSNGGGLSMAKCSSGSSMESGLTQDAIRVHRAICNAYPSITSYGGMRSGGSSFHTSGRAVDVMVSSSSKRSAVAAWVRANRKALGVSEVIYSRRIWTAQRGGEGWRPMSDRGNTTANHEDHVHVSVYGNRGTS